MLITAAAIILSWVVISALLFISTFIFYLAVLKLRDAFLRGTLSKVHFTVRWSGYLILSVGLTLDALLNWFFLSVTFLEFPREILSTARVARHKQSTFGWRHAQAIWWCHNWLTPFDTDHC